MPQLFLMSGGILLIFFFYFRYKNHPDYIYIVKSRYRLNKQCVSVYRTIRMVES